MAVKVTVYGTADMKQIESARAELDRLESQALANSNGFAGSMTRMGSSLESAGEKMSAVGGSMTAKFTVPLVAAGAGLALLTNGAAEDAQQQDILAKALSNTAGATAETIKQTEDWISAQGRALGVTDDQLRPALQTLATATHDVGRAQELAGLAMDLAAAKGIPVEDAAKAIAKAYDGQNTALKKLVPGIDDAALASGDFAQVQQALTDIVGGQAANAAGGYAGQLQRVKVGVSEAGEAVGTAFLPVMQEVLDLILDKGIPAVQGFADWLQTIPTPVLTAGVGIAALVAAAGPLLMMLGSFSSGAGVFLQLLPKIGSALGGALGPIGLVIGLLAALIATSPELQKMIGDLVQQIGSVLGPIFGELVKSVQPVLAMLGPMFASIIAQLVPIIGQLLTAIAPLITALGGTLMGIIIQLVSSGLLETIAGAFMAIVNAIIPVVSAIAGSLMVVIQALISSGILQMLANAFVAIVTAVMPLIPVVAQLVMAFLPLLPPIMELISALIPPLVDLLSAVLPVAMAIVVTAVKVVVSILQFLISVIVNVVSAVVGFVAGFISNVTKLAADVGAGIGNIINWFMSLPGKIGDALAGAARWLVDIGGNIIQGLWDGLSNAWDWLVSQVKNLFGGLVDVVKGILGIHSPSTVFAEIGDNITAGLVNSLNDGQKDVATAMSGLATSATTSFVLNASSGPSQEVSGLGAVSMGASRGPTQITIAEGAIQITISGDADPDSVKEAVSEAFDDLLKELQAQ